jgi:CrcB protein
MWLVIFLCSALGGALRQALLLTMSPPEPGRFPYGTLLVNVSGCLAIGLLWGWFAREIPSTETGAILDRGATLWIVIGLLGGYTTVSTFALDTLDLLHRSKVGMAAGYLGATWFLGFAAVAAGWQLMAH